MHELRGDAGREGDGAGGGGVVRPGERGSVGGGVVDRHRLGGRLVQGRDEHEMAVFAVAFGDRQVGDGHRRRGGRRLVDIVVDDGAEARRVGDRRVDRSRQGQRELLVQFDPGVTVDGDRDGFRSLAGGEREGAHGGVVVPAGGGGGAVAGRVSHRHHVGARLRQRHREGQRRGAGVALGRARITDRQARHRNRGFRTVDEVLPLDPGTVIERDDVAGLQFAERDTGQCVGLVVVDDRDPGGAVDLVDVELLGLEPTEVQLVEGRVEIERGMRAVLPRDRRRGAGLAGGRGAVTRCGGPVVGSGHRDSLGQHLAVGHGADSEL